MMTSGLGVTLVIPSHNRGDRIGPTLESVARQSRMPDEVLVVNDGGFPATTSYVLRHHPFAKVIDVKHGGAPMARNRGAEQAGYPILMFLDDDDTLLPNAVEVLVGLLRSFPAAHAAFADHTYTNHITGERLENHHRTLPNFRRLTSVRPLKRTVSARLVGRNLYYAMLHGNLLQQPWMTYRETYLSLGGYQNGLGSADDWDLYMRILRQHSVAVTDIVIANHFTERDRPHLTLGPRQMEAQMEVMRRHLKLARWRDPRAIWVLRRRLGNGYKTLGDQSRQDDVDSAIKRYRLSLAAWPFDHVVAVRSFIWPIQRLFKASAKDL